MLSFFFRESTNMAHSFAKQVRLISGPWSGSMPLRPWTLFTPL